MTEAFYSGARRSPGTIELLDHGQTDLVGATLRWKRYRPWTTARPLGCCELCGTRFSEGASACLNSGYSVLGAGPAGQDDYRWICAVCYDVGRDDFCWTVLDTRGRANEPPNLLEVALGLMEWPLAADTDESDEDGPTIAPLPHRW
jgi:hypothetical protein